MNETYDYGELRAAVRIVRHPFLMEDVLDAAKLLADYTEASLNHADEVDRLELN